MMKAKTLIMGITVLMLLGGASAEMFGEGLDVSVEHEYSSIIMPEGSVQHFDLRVSNNLSETVNLETELSSVYSEFTSNENKSKSYTVPPKSNKTFRIKISPQVSQEGLKNLEITTKNRNTSLEKTFRFPVYIRNPPNTQRLQLPGTSPLAVLILFLTAAVFLYHGRPSYS